jgi:hypothetical protein
MKIHSSSLHSPSSLNQKAGRNNSAQNNEPSAAKDAQDKKVNLPLPSSTEDIKKTLANVDLTSQNNIIKPTDSRTLRALSAYNQEFNAPQQAQRAQLITGIDAYA